MKRDGGGGVQCAAGILNLRSLCMVLSVRTFHTGEQTARPCNSEQTADSKSWNNNQCLLQQKYRDMSVISMHWFQAV